MNAKEVTFVGETHDVPTDRIKTENRKTATIKIAGAEENNPTYIHVKQHRSEWCKDEGENYGKEDTASLQSCTENSLYDEYDWTKDTYYYLKPENIKHYVLKNFMGAFNEMWIGRIYEAGQKVGSFDEYFGKVNVQVTVNDELSKKKTLYFVGYGSTRRSDSDLKNGKVYYKDLITDIAEEKLNARAWYFANFAEKDATKTITIESNSTHSINKQTFDTYRFFDKAYKKLEEIVSDGTKQLQYKKGDAPAPLQNANDSTLIDGKLTLVISEIASRP